MLATLRAVGRWLIILFCLFHMTAIALYLVPDGWLTKAKFVTSPYVLSTSQWQKWDIFSPNPFRRVGIYEIQEWKTGRWQTVEILQPKNFPWYERATMMKVLERLEEDEWKFAAQQFLLDRCDDAPYAGQQIRLAMTYTVLPDNVPELTHLSGKDLPKSKRILGEPIICQ